MRMLRVWLVLGVLSCLSFRLEGARHGTYDYEDGGMGISDTPVPTVTATMVTVTATPIIGGLKDLKAVLSWRILILFGLGFLLGAAGVILSKKERRVLFKHLCWTWFCGGRKKEALLAELQQLIARIEQAKQDEVKVQKQLMDSVLAHGNARTETRAMQIILEEVEQSIARLRKLLALNLEDAQELQDGAAGKEER